MPPSLRSRPWIILAGLFTVIWFGALDVRALHHPDEGRYAEIAREMHASGDWVTPRLNGLKYFEKPPLQYWLTAASYAAFGVHDWTARLPAALFGWLAIAAIGAAGTRIAGPATGWLAAALLGSMVWPIALAHFLTLDAVLTGWLTLAFAAFVTAQSAAPARQRTWMLAAWAASAGAVLTKGLVGLAIPGGALVLYTLATRDLALWRRLALVPGLALMLVVCVPWFAVVSARNPEFAHFFFVHEHVQRFLTTEHQREGAWWYFVPLLVLGLLPWTAVLGAGLARAWRDAPRTREGFAWLRFAWAWIAFVFLFFSLSGSKLPSYILPLFPPAALIIAWHVERMSSSMWRVLLALLALGAAALAAATWLGYDALAAQIATERTPLASYAAFGVGVRVGMTIVAVGAIAAWGVARRWPRAAPVALLALAMDAGLAAALWANPGLDDARSAQALVQRLANETTPMPADAPFYQVRLYDQTLPWYLRRVTTLVDYRDELGLGEDAEPGKSIPDVRDWMTQWRTLPQGYALMAPDTYDALAQQGLEARVVARTGRYVLLARR